MINKLIAVVLFAFAVSTAGFVAPSRIHHQKDSDAAFTVGVLTGDGVIVPFAQFSNGKWTNPWHSPRSVDQPDEPETIADLPKPWYESLVKTADVWYLTTPLGNTKSVTLRRTFRFALTANTFGVCLAIIPIRNSPKKMSASAISESRSTKKKKRDRLNA